MICRDLGDAIRHHSWINQTIDRRDLLLCHCRQHSYENGDFLGYWLERLYWSHTTIDCGILSMALWYPMASTMSR